MGDRLGDDRPARIAELVAATSPTGAIVLLHDSPRYADRASAEPTAQALAALAQRARDAGLTCASLGEARSTPSAAS